MSNGTGNPSNLDRDVIEVQKERIGLAKYITTMSLGVSAGIYVFIGATIGGVTTKMDGVSLADTISSFLGANPFTIILISALVAFLIAIVMGIVVISNHIKNWGNVGQPYNGREWSMMGFASSGVLFLLIYLLVISRDITIVAITTYGQIILTGFFAICLLAMFIYTTFLFIRMVGESLFVLRELCLLCYYFVKFIAQVLISMAQALNKKFRP